MTGAGSDADDGSRGIVRHAEAATVTNDWVPVSRVRMIKRVVTEIQTIEVQVRREELVITDEPVPSGAAEPLPFGRAPITPEPRIFVLHAEVPSVSLTILPVERVTVAPVVVTADRDIDVDLTAEHLRIESVPPTSSADERGNLHDLSHDDVTAR